MPVTIIKGDLFTTKDELIAHGVNTVGQMGAGVAKEIKMRFPEVNKSYRNHTISVGRDLLGSCYFCHAYSKNSDIRYVANLYTQQHTGSGRQVNYEAVYSSFNRLFDSMSIYNIKRLSIPKIGAGLGGGNWRIIQTMIEELCPEDVQVTIYDR